ncbi:8-methylmenaquinol:fumarate reductase flavoprotein subunit [Fundidesulfovibrio magnetotacticus]|uniref:8-methylmenaquinol:fumarate reductase flavoprotein subunit n=1 Tax=Fundidesulfovibrio magnetotacticus TaxID=2730080 RepID=A0A6V8LZ14_9BACT|nr:FAD-binding protein [Fundidesulfovibrio magnetotacticus]GFK96040.1 8-methylmenaquinol:fumarate reductase flavoprotein subunit [Fundidesulfovibrio magnetotacticus]
MERLRADVLVLGAGLAGLRAALSCLRAAPGLDVLVVSLTGGPSGSSFANRNDALGVHVCLNDAEREAFVAEVAALNRGALLDPALTAIMAQEGEARLRELDALGLPFVRDDSGGLLDHPSCFSPHSRRAFLFRGLAQAHRRFRAALEALGCRFLGGHAVARIEMDRREALPRACGALLLPARPGASPAPRRAASRPDAPCAQATSPLAVEARAVVTALGGPARLFARTIAGPGVPGFGHVLLGMAGARLANQGYLQFLWGALPGGRFWSPAELGSGGWRIMPPLLDDAMAGFDPSEGVPVEELLPDLARLAGERAGHCPCAHGLPDAALDLELVRAMDADGSVLLLTPGSSPLAVALMAHASNGGALIDRDGGTGVLGLFACGECATGMHGSNRIGGAMVLATQVFGHRAGEAAARFSRDVPEGLASRGSQDFQEDAEERSRGLAWLGRGLTRHAAPMALAGAKGFAADIRRLDTARDWRLRLSLQAALGVLSGQGVV